MKEKEETIQTTQFTSNPAPIIKPPEPPQSTIDKIADNSLFTKYPILISICVFSSLLADGMEMNIMNLFIIPLRTYFDLSQFQIELVASTLFLGVASGSFLSGIFTEQLGRVTTLHFSFFLLFFSHAMMAIANDIAMFIILRIFIGFTLGLIVPISLNLYSEFLPMKMRGFFLMVAWFFFTLGVFLMGIIMRCEMPNLEISKVKRVFMILTIFPLLSLILNLIFVSDSPRNLILNKQREKAFSILRSMNHDVELSIEQKRNAINEVNNTVNKSTTGAMKDLFSKEYIKTTILMIILFFINGCALYGLYVISSLTQQEMTIDEEEIDNKKIINTQIIIAFVSLFGYVIGGILLEIPKIGRKGVICIWLLINAIMCIPAVYFPKMFTLFISIAILSTNVWGNVLITYLIEVYPTRLRDTSSGFILFTFRISIFISQFIFLGLFEIHYRVSYYLAAGLLLIGVILTILLPFEPVNQPLDIAIAEEEKDELINEKPKAIEDKEIKIEV